MSEFTLVLSLRSKRGDPPISYAIELDQELRISVRAIDEMKAGVSTFDGAIHLMKTREIRKDLFIETAKRLGYLLAERMEDAEGWHDYSRIDPARKQLGGRWE